MSVPRLTSKSVLRNADESKEDNKSVVNETSNNAAVGNPGSVPSLSSLSNLTSSSENDLQGPKKVKVFNRITDPVARQEAAEELRGLSARIENDQKANPVLNSFYESRDNTQKANAQEATGGSFSGIDMSKTQSPNMDTTAAQTIMAANSKATGTAYSGLSSNRDYAENSGYTPVPQGYGLFNKQGYDFDKTRSYINKDPYVYSDPFSPAYDTETSPMVGKEYLAAMTDDEVKNYNYLYNTKGKREANDYIDNLKSDLVGRMSQKKVEITRNAAAAHPGYMSAASVLAKPAEAIAYAGQVADNIKSRITGEEAPNRVYNITPQAITATREVVGQQADKAVSDYAQSGKIGSEVVKKLNEKGYGGSWLYGTAMSMADNLYNILLGQALFGPASALANVGDAAKVADIIKKVAKQSEIFTLLTMSTEAAAETYLANKEKGMDDNEALTKATASGAIEYITEKIGFDALFGNIFKSKSTLRYLLANTAAEGGEEGLSDILNYLSDDLYDLINGTESSEFKRSVQEYINQGYSKEAATGMAYSDFWHEFKLDVVGGALSGALMSGGNRTIQNINGATGYINAAKSGDIADFNKGLIESGLESPEDTQSYKVAKEAQRKLDKNGKLDIVTASRLYAANELQAEVESAALSEADEDSIYTVTGTNKNLPGAKDRAYKRAEKSFANARTILDKDASAITNADKFNLNVAKHVMTNALNNSWYADSATKTQLVNDINRINQAIGVNETLNVNDYVQSQQTESTAAEEAAPFKSNYKTATASYDLNGNTVNIEYPAVGKKRQDSYTFHKSYVEDGSPIANIISSAPAEAQGYDTVRVYNDGRIELTAYDDFDGEGTPVSTARYEGVPGTNGYTWTQVDADEIIYDKYNYVADGYSGFDANEARQNEATWKAAAKKYGISYDPEQINNRQYFRSIMAHIAQAQANEAQAAAEAQRKAEEEARAAEEAKAKAEAEKARQEAEEQARREAEEAQRQAEAEAEAQSTANEPATPPQSEENAEDNIQTESETEADKMGDNKPGIESLASNEEVKEAIKTQTETLLKDAFDDMFVGPVSVDEFLEIRDNLLQNALDFVNDSPDAGALGDNERIELVLNTVRSGIKSFLEKNVTLQGYKTDAKIIADFANSIGSRNSNVKNVLGDFLGKDYTDIIDNLFTALGGTDRQAIIDAYEDFEAVFRNDIPSLINDDIYVSPELSAEELEFKNYCKDIKVAFTHRDEEELVYHYDGTWGDLKNKMRNKIELTREENAAPGSVYIDQFLAELKEIAPDYVNDNLDSYTNFMGVIDSLEEIYSKEVPAGEVFDYMNEIQYGFADDFMRDIMAKYAAEKYNMGVAQQGMKGEIKNNGKAAQSGREKSPVQEGSVRNSGRTEGSGRDNGEQGEAETGRQEEAPASQDKQEVEQPKTEQQNELNSTQQAVADGLKSNDRVVVNGYIISIYGDGSSYKDSVRVHPSYTMIHDARSMKYDGGPFATRQEAVDDIVAVAKWLDDSAYNTEAKESNNEQQADNGISQGTESEGVQGTEKAGNIIGEDKGTARGSELPSGSAEKSGVETDETGSQMGDNGNNGEEPGDRVGGDSSRGRTETRDGEDYFGPVIKTDPQEGKKPLQRFNSNIEAIETLQKIMNENRQATPEEVEILSQYTGWGGLKDAFTDATTRAGKERNEKLESLLTKQQYKDIRESSLSAFYTPVSVINDIYESLGVMGFTGGTVLEPSCGTGLFLGAMPEAMRKNSNVIAVEKEPISGNIAKYLYPGADVRVSGFEAVNIPSGSVDLIVGNVPFISDFKVNDPNYKEYSKEDIHNYFILKGIDLLSDNGVMAVITSTATMDSDSSASTRKTIMEKADVKFVYRFPSGTFGATSEPADIIVLQKKSTTKKRRSNSNIDYAFAFDPNASIDITKMGMINGVKVNKYFEQNQDHILGTVDKNGQGRLVVKSDGRTLKSVMDQIPKNIISKAKQEKHNSDIINKPVKADVQNDTDSEILRKYPEGSTIVKGGRAYTIDNQKFDPAFRWKETKTVDPKTGKKVTVREKDYFIEGTKDYRRILALNELSDAYQKLLYAMETTEGEEALIEPRKTFNRLYDKFQRDFAKSGTPGYLNDQRNKYVLPTDTRLQQLQSTEESYKENGKTKYRKGDVFTKRTVKVSKLITAVDSVADALSASLNVNGRIDLDYMSSLYGRTAEQIIAELGDKIIELPEVPGSYVLRDEYLSGNVRKKLAEVQALNKDGKYQKQVDALTAAIPVDVPAEQITIIPGAGWIDTQAIEEFIRDLAKQPDAKVKAVYSELGARWGVEAPAGGPMALWGTDAVSGEEVLSAMLNRIPITVNYKDTSGNSHVDTERTAAANAKVSEMSDYFKSWLFKDADRRERLTRRYNDMLNNTVNRKYDGSYLTMPGMALESLYDHQQNGIARMLSNRTTLLAHPAGSGKTFEMIGAIHEMKRLGMASKTLLVVPNHKLEDFISDYYKMYPNANILAVHSNEFSKKSRQAMIRRIQTTDPEVIIIRQSSFAQFAFSKEYQERYLQERLDELETAIREAKEGGMSKRDITNLVKRLKTYETKLEQLQNIPNQDEIIPLDQIGIDALFVDEAHNYKNLFNPTKYTRVGGAGTGDSAIATKMHMMTQLMYEKGNKVVFATATPMSNTIGEMYNMTRFLRPDLLTENHISSYDAFLDMFATQVGVSELTSSGTGIQVRQRFTGYNNIPELMKQVFLPYADVLQVEDLNLKGVPEAEERHITVESTMLQNYFNRHTDRLKSEIKGRKLEKGEPNALVYYGDNKMVALDPRLVYNLMIKDGLISPNIKIEDLDFPGSKINKLVETIFKEYQDSNDIKGTQVVFLDRGTPTKIDAKTLARQHELESKLAQYEAEGGEELSENELAELDDIRNKRRYNFNLYDDIKQKLIRNGVPAEEIAFIQDTQGANSDKKKEELFEKVRAGEVRVLIGSTPMMGEGMNVQDRAVAVHNVNAPDRPSDITQRNARVVRQRNQNKNVRVYYYSTLNSFDGASWQKLDIKNKAFNSIMKGDETVRELEDLGEDSFAEMSVEAANNPLIFKRTDLIDEINKIELAQKNRNRDLYTYEQFMRSYDHEHSIRQQRSAFWKSAFETVKENSSPNAKIGDKVYDKPTEASMAIAEWAKDRFANGEYISQLKYSTIGELHGLPIEIRAVDNFGNFNIKVDGLDELSIKAQLTREEGAPFGDPEASVTSDRFSTIIQRLNSRLNTDADSGRDNIATRLRWAEKDLDTLEKQHEAALKNPVEPFPESKIKELSQKRNELKEVEAELNKIGSETSDPFIGGYVYSMQDLIEDKNNSKGSIDAMQDVSKSNDSNDKPPKSDTRKRTEDFMAAGKTAKARATGETALFKPSKNADINDAKNRENLRNLLKQMSRDFRIGFEMGGKYSGPRTSLGYYNSTRPAVHTRGYQDASAAMHELGHAIDDRYKLRDKFADKLDAIAKKSFSANVKNAYDNNPERLRHEVVAETIRLYMLNPNGLEEFEGDTGFVRDLEHTLSKDDLRLLKKYGKRLRNTINIETIEKIKGTIESRADKKRDNRNVQEKLNAVETGVFEEYAPYEKMVKVIEKQTGKNIAPSLNPFLRAQQSRSANSIAANIITNGLHAPNNNKYVAPSLTQILKPVINNEQEFAAYLKNAHAMEWFEQGKQVYYGEMDSLEKMQEADAAFKERFPEFERVADDVYHWFDTFERLWVVGTGLIDADTYSTLRTLNPHYVSNTRVYDRAGKKAGQNSGKLIQYATAKGSDLNTYDPLESMMLHVGKAVQAAMNMQVFQTMDTLYRDQRYKSAMGMFISEVTSDKTHNVVNTQYYKGRAESKIAKVMLDRGGASKKEYERVMDYGTPYLERIAILKKYGALDIIDIVEDEFDDYLEAWIPKKGTKAADEFDVHYGDTSRHYRVIDPEMANMLMNADRGSTNELISILAKMRRTTTALTTSLNPMFAVMSNPWRDLPLHYIKGSEANPVKFAGQLIQSVVDIIKQGDRYKSYIASGGGSGSILSEDANKLLRTIGTAVGKKPTNIKEGIKYAGHWAMGKIIDLNDLVEAAGRLAEYSRTYAAVLDKGGTKEDAMILGQRAAAELKTDFSRSGSNEALNTIKAISPYMSAGFNGLYDLRNLYTGKGAKYEGMTKGERVKAITETYVKSIICLTIPTILLALAHRDDDEYEALPEYYKNGYWIINQSWLGGKKNDFIRIPKPHEIGFLFSNTVDAIINEVLDKEIDNGKALADAFKDSFIPSYNTIFKPIFDVKANQTWYGGDLVSSVFDDYMDDPSGYDEVYDDTTSKLAIGLAKLLPNSEKLKYLVTPKGIEYLMDQYGGVISDILLPLTSETSEGVIHNVATKRITVDSNLSNKYPTEFYDISDRLSVAHKKADTDSETDNEVMYTLFNSTSKGALQELKEAGINFERGGVLEKLMAVENVSASGSVSYGKAPSKRLGELWGEIRSLNNDQSLSRTQRQYKIAECHKEINAIAKESVEIYNKYAERFEGKSIDNTAPETAFQKKVKSYSTSYGINDLDTSFKNEAGEVVQLSYDEHQNYQKTYEDTYWGYMEEVFDSAENEVERTALSDAAKSAAKARAKNSISPNSDSYFNKVEGYVSDIAFIKYKAAVNVANNDKSLKQEDYINIINSLGYDNTTNYWLFHSQYNSDKNNPWSRYK